MAPIFSLTSFFPGISHRDAELLCTPVTFLEVQKAVFDMVALKAPGPDGFQPIFYQCQWTALSGHVYEFVRAVFKGRQKI